MFPFTRKGLPLAVEIFGVFALASILWLVAPWGWAKETLLSVSDESFLPIGGRDIQIRKTPGFVVGYSNARKNAVWVAYHLTEKELRGRVRRSDDFRVDPEISNSSASLLDYQSSGFERGHLAPAGDMKWSVSAMSHSFLLSNISPQLRKFNGGSWLDLENAIRAFVRNSFRSVYIVVGPIIEGKFKTIGHNKVVVPNHYWKVVYDYQANDMTAYLLPHNETDLNFKNYVVTVDRLELLTGLNFFSALPDMQENSLESNLGNFSRRSF